MQLRKFFASIATLALGLSVVAPAASAAFNDQSSIPSWATVAVDQLVADGVLSGYSNGRFGPNDPLTRAQLAKIAVLASNTPVQSSVSSSGFPDVPATHWAAPYVKAAYNAGIISGYQNGNFGPNDTVTRAQAAKILVGAFGLAMHTEQGPNFPDVPASSWEYEYVETAYFWSVLNGYQNGNFGPNDPVTRAQVAVMVVGAQNPEVRPEYQDIDDDGLPADILGISSVEALSSTQVAVSFNMNVQASSAEDISNYSITGSELEVLGASLGINSRTVTLTTAQQVSGHDYIVSAFDIMSSDGLQTIDEDYDSLGFIGYVTAVSSNSFRASVSPSSPVASAIPQNANNVPYLVVDLTAGSSEDVKVTKLVIERRGLGNDNDFDNIYLYDGATRLTNGRKFSSENHTATFNLYTPIVVPAGRTKSITVTGTMAGNANKINYLQIAFPEDVVAVGATSGGAVTVSGNFPIRGAEMETIDVASGTLTIAHNGTVNDSAKVGDNQAEFALFKLTASNEDILVTSIALENKGSGSEDIENITLYDDLSGEPLVAVAAIPGHDEIVFDLTGLADGGIYIKKGNKALFSVKADVVTARATSDKIDIQLDNKADIIGIGQTYGYGVFVDNSGITGANLPNLGNVSGGVAIQSTDLVFDWTKPVYTDISGDQTDVIMGILNITNRSEDILMKTLKFDLAAKTSTGVAIANDIANLIDNIEIVDPAGVVVAGPTTPGAAAAGSTAGGYVEFTDNWLIPSGTQEDEYTIRADLKNANVNGYNYTFTLKTTNSSYFDAEGNVTGNTVDTSANVTPSSSSTDGITSDAITIQESTLTMAVASTPASQTIVAGNETELLGITLSTNDSGVIKVTKIPVDFFYASTGSAAYGQTDISTAGISAKLYTEDGVLLSEKSLQGTVNFDSFNEDLVIASGGQAKLIVKMNTSTAAANHSKVAAQVTTNVVTAQDEQGNALNTDQLLPASTKVNEVPTTYDSNPKVYMSIVTSGTLAVTIDIDTPISNQVMLGGNGINLMKLNLNAADEDVYIKKLRVQMANPTSTGYFAVAGASGDSADSLINKLYLYDGSTMISEGLAIIDGGAGNVGYAEWTLAGASRIRVPKDGETVVTIKGDMNVSNNNANIVNGLLDQPAFRLVVMSGSTGIEAEGSKATVTPNFVGNASSIGGGSTDSIASRFFYPYDTLPTVALAADPAYGAKGAPSNGMKVFGFTISAANNTKDPRTQAVKLKAMELLISATPGTYFSGFTAYSADNDQPLNSTPQASTLAGGSGTGVINFASFDGAANDLEITEGTTKTYYVKVDNASGKGDNSSLSVSVSTLGSIATNGLYGTGKVVWDVVNASVAAPTNINVIRQTPSDVVPAPMTFTS